MPVVVKDSDPWLVSASVEVVCCGGSPVVASPEVLVSPDEAPPLSVPSESE
ncbi:hypothetical protein [Nannocystis pusilla]|uniref:hypothetical protein n=1 Tax=Nannocystis pusilla TaxID=889268 RepID=UPI003B82A9C7